MTDVQTIALIAIGFLWMTLNVQALLLRRAMKRIHVSFATMIINIEEGLDTLDRRITTLEEDRGRGHEPLNHW